MKLPNGYGSVVKLSGKRRNPYLVRKTNGWHFDKEKDKQVQDFIIIGYAPTRVEGLQMLADYNKNPFDSKAAKMTFDDVYEEWSNRKYPTVSESNVKGYTAAYKTCSSLYHKVFKDLKLVDLQTVIDTCGKNYPTFVDVVQYKDRNSNKYDRNKFEEDCIAILLMSRWRAIFVSEYMAVSASTPIQYSSTKTPLVENAHNKKGHFPAFATEKCPIHIIDICVAYLLHMCCIPFEIQHI